MRCSSMKQQSLAAAADHGAGFEQYRPATRRDVFLATMNEIVPWRELSEVIEPRLFAAVGQMLQARGLKVGTGTIVDATIIGAPSSTKNADKARDPENG